MNKALDFIATAIREDLLPNKAGLHPPKLPVVIGGIRYPLAGRTSYNRFTEAPTGIELDPELLYQPNGVVELSAVLAHEMIHTALPYAEDHGPKFAEAHHAIGLAGAVTASHSGREFRAWFAEKVAPGLNKLLEEEDHAST